MDIVEEEGNIDVIDSFSDSDEPPTKRRRTEGGANGYSEEDKIVGPILYDPAESLPEILSSVNTLLEVHVLAKYLTLKNPKVKSNAIWGSGQYTTDSDVVAMLQHSGQWPLHEKPPDLFGVRVFFRISDGLNEYKGRTMNGVSSQAWSWHAVSFSVERVLPMTSPTPATLRLQRKKELSNSGDFTHKAEAVLPTSQSPVEARKFSLVHMSLFPNTVLMYNLSNEPCFGYDQSLLCDRGSEPEKWTSYKLKQVVLYIESLTERYELARESRLPSREGSSKFDLYRWVKVKRPYHLDRLALEKTQVPLDVPSHGTLLHSHLDWNQIVWGPDSVTVDGTEYKASRIFWYPRSTLSRPQQQSS
eukprot:TRINITY_DN3719_c0_g1_i1.p1 TRINITY_DN3719_c0_g1~~TRINITY_DN3719_c0_g1_i1.p1  ORF type:complete len:367 (+),score=54.28 TRINITY_DN3719_c0_g1_i1:27-1103(+)